MDVSIIFVNWNSTDFLRESIASIYRWTTSLSFEIIVVDNASPAHDCDRLTREFPGISLIKSPENLGFAGANNLGFRQAGGTYIVFLNPDTVLVSPAFELMLKQLAELSNAGIVGCKLLNTDLTIQTTCIQTFPTIANQVLDVELFRLRWPQSRLWGIAPLFSKFTEPVPVEAISGACMMVDREVFERIGLFSEEYFMYAEDLDLCRKAMGHGFRNYYIGEASVVHHGGKSSNPESAARRKWISILQYLTKHRGTAYTLAFRSAMVPVSCLRLGALRLLALVAWMLGRDWDVSGASAKWRIILATLLLNPAPAKARPATRPQLYATVAARRD